MSASVEHLAWLRAHGFDPAGLPPSESQRAATRARRLDQLENQVERAQQAVAMADDAPWRRRAEAKLERLEAERDRLEQEDWPLQDWLAATGRVCDVCGAPVLKSTSDYGRARCAACLNRRRPVQ